MNLNTLIHVIRNGKENKCTCMQKINNGRLDHSLNSSLLFPGCSSSRTRWSWYSVVSRCFGLLKNSLFHRQIPWDFEFPCRGSTNSKVKHSISAIFYHLLSIWTSAPCSSRYCKCKSRHPSNLHLASELGF